ncbi:MAG: gliding motility protein GldL [Bacteroidetes bacterium]|nr:gliding motility protein GldL [Bacteroidota bacterium]
MAGQNKSFFLTKSGKTILNYAYSGGAAVVIMGALFKIMHWPGANQMLIAGMGTEVIIFLISAFEPQFDTHLEYEWERVYPELLSTEPVAKKSSEKPLTQQLDKMLAENKVGPELISSLGKGLSSLADSTGKLNDLTEASVAVNDFAKNAKSASGNIVNFASAAATATSAVSDIGKSAAVLSETANDATKFKEQLGQLNKNLANLNSVYGNMLSAMRTNNA